VVSDYKFEAISKMMMISKRKVLKISKLLKDLLDVSNFSNFSITKEVDKVILYEIYLLKNTCFHDILFLQV
jgi:hypothetical protein